MVEAQYWKIWTFRDMERPGKKLPLMSNPWTWYM